MGEEVGRLFALDRNRAWRRFDRLFAKDIRQRIRRRFPQANEAARQDKFQQVAVELLEDDFRRIRLYSGRGSFWGYVMQVVDRILIDIMRGEEAARRRLPVEIERLSKLHQLIFIAGAWQSVPLDPDRMMEAINGKTNPPPSRIELMAAIERVAGPIAAAQANVKPKEISLDAGEDGNSMPEIASSALNPEDALLEREEDEARAARLEQLRQKAEALPPDLRFYLALQLQASKPTPPREIAREMAIPVEHVYKLRQKMKLWRENISVDLQKNASLSV